MASESARALESGADGAAAVPRLNEEGTGGCAAPDLGRLFALCRRCDHACEHNRAQCTIKIYSHSNLQLPAWGQLSKSTANPSVRQPRLPNRYVQTLCYYLLALAPRFPHCVFFACLRIRIFSWRIYVIIAGYFTRQCCSLISRGIRHFLTAHFFYFN